jgi:pSer/pThr/pTyr-binding forkhead associated (FHA) protein
MPQIIVSRDRAEIDRYDLTDTVVIGRSRECGLFIDDAKVSRQHCRIERRPQGGWRIVDLGSRNGLIFQGQPITERTLRDGDRIWLGKHIRLKFVDTAAAPAAPRRQRPSDPMEALRLAGVSAPAMAAAGPVLPAPMPQAWEDAAAAPTADDAPTPSTGLSFGKPRRPSRPPAPGIS